VIGLQDSINDLKLSQNTGQRKQLDPGFKVDFKQLTGLMGLNLQKPEQEAARPPQENKDEQIRQL
jgi:hypothetical protein